MSTLPPAPAEFADLIPVPGYPARRYRYTATGAYCLAVWRFGRFEVVGQNPHYVPNGWMKPDFTELLPLTASDLRQLLASGSLLQDDPQ